MAAKLKVGVLVVLVVVSSAAFAASANMTANIDRSASVDVVDDSNGLLALEPGTSDVVSQDTTSGALSINFAQDNATGVNVDSTFTVGDNTSAMNSPAFNITNQDASSRDVTLNYTARDGDPDTATSNIKFNVHNSTGSFVGTADEGDSSVTHTLTSGEKAYVVIVVDTHGLTQDDSLTGTLTIDV